jgi:hypothetical protein
MTPRLSCVAAGSWPALLLGLLVAQPGEIGAGGLKLSAEELAVRERQAAEDAVQLLQLSGLADEAAARRLRRRAGEILSHQPKTATPAELIALAARVAAALPAAVHSFAEAREVLGPPPVVTREILFRRYVEQWFFESPLPLVLVFDCPTGQEARLQAVQVNRSQKK